ncbi:MAG: helix-turn-helix transcriptional regulator [Phycisphaerales bacterium]|nr:helix-turn-helix transcriptional regulator [Phycisphaerales bacterium]
MDKRIFTEREWQVVSQELGLSPRQHQIVRLITKSLTTKEIACRLGISQHTVQMHMKGLFKKLEVTDRVGVVVKLVCVSKQC